MTLNLHPADGVAAHEDAYPAVCKAMGHALDGTPVPFDITDKKYVDAYFKYLHHPIERQGTSGTSTKQFVARADTRSLLQRRGPIVLSACCAWAG